MIDIYVKNKRLKEYNQKWKYNQMVKHINRLS